MSLRVVIDNSTLMSAAIRPDSIPDQVLQCVIGSPELCVSLETLDELERVLKRKQLDRYNNLDERMLILNTIRGSSTLVAVAKYIMDEVHSDCRDASDDKFLALCLAAHENVLVSSDQDLLVLNPWRSIPILTPAQFVSQFSV